MAWWNAKNRLEPIQAANATNQNKVYSRAEDMIDSLIKLETYRSMVIDNHKKAAEGGSVLNEVRDLLTAHFEREPDEGGNTADAMMITLLGKVMAGQQQAPPHADVAEVKDALDVETTAAHMVDVVKQQYPKILKQIRDGKISKAQALALMGAQGVRSDVAQRAYELAVEGVA